MNNQSSYCGLVNAKIRASDKDLPVSEPIITYSGSQVGCDVRILMKM